MSEKYKIKTVMTIDDNEIDQLLYNRIISRSGLVEKVISYQYAEDALTYLKSDDSDEIDIILLDINMPRMNGFEFLEQVSSDLGPEFSSLVVIMLTTSLDPEEEKRARTYSAVKAYLKKPLTVENLDSIVQILPP